MRCLTFLENGPFADIFCSLIQGDASVRIVGAEPLGSPL